MPDKFDPYREALVVETDTVWPDQYDGWEPEDRTRLEQALHASPDQAADIEYLRIHTGFCRRIRVTPQDVERLGRQTAGRGK
jgi:hypothetical protein